MFVSHQALVPDPILKLRRVVGFGGCETKDVSVNPFVTSPGDLRDLVRLFRYEARRSPGLTA